jgi:Domain of unknown function (DUF6249)
MFLYFQKYGFWSSKIISGSEFWNCATEAYVSCGAWRFARSSALRSRRTNMNGDLTGLVAVIMIFGIPIAAMYTYYRVRKLRSEERLAAIARGVSVPMEPELPHAARSRRAGILLVAAGLGYTATFALVARAEPDAMIAAAFGLIPLTLGIGFFIDAALVRRDLRVQ